MLEVAAKIVIVFVSLVTALGQSKAVPVSYPKPIISLFCTVVTVKLCDGEVVIHSTNGHLVLITRSLSKIRALLRAFYTMCY